MYPATHPMANVFRVAYQQKNPLYGLGDCTTDPSGPGCQSNTEVSINKYTSSPWFMFYKILSIAGAATGAYHGYKRNDSVGWAIGWFLLGGMFPFITIPVSLAQGYGKPHYKTVTV